VGKCKEGIDAIRKGILSRLLRYIQRTDTLLALLAIGLWGMLWSQAYTNLDGITNFLERISDKDEGWGGFHCIEWSSNMHIVVSIFYWVCLIAVVIVVSVLAYAALHLLFGKGIEEQKADSEQWMELIKENRMLLKENRELRRGEKDRKTKTKKQH